MSNTIEQVLLRDGFVVYKVKGVSMNPMLYQDRDVITVRKKQARLKKYDVALYRVPRTDNLVLHRVIRVTPDGYIIRGDNCITDEVIPEDDVYGVLTDFVRNKKSYTVRNIRYRIYAVLRVRLYPLRRLRQKAVIRFWKIADRVIAKIRKK
ncbi:MAG TPA: hypothetical protein DDY98_06485 [Ruminococcaceae bacterium]|nr:hypothetical protein [Oscillospiraceae bacterium]